MLGNIFEPSKNGFQLHLAETGTLEAPVIEWATDLSNWEIVPSEKMLVGDNAIPIGTSLMTIGAQGDEGTHYYRVRMVFD